MEITHEQDGAEGRLADIIAIVRDTVFRRWKMLAAVSILVFALGVAGIMMLTPKYTSTTRVQIDPNRNPLAGADSAKNNSDTLAPEAIETEVSLVNSKDTALAVVRALNLVADPEFAPVPDAGAPPLTPDQKAGAVADQLLRKMAVSRERLTYILDISFTDPSAQKAAAIANAFADAYVATKAGSSSGTAQKQAQWFQQRLDALGTQVSSADAAAAQYRAKAGIVQDSAGNSVGSITDQQIAPLASQLATAQADAAAAHAKLAAANAQIATGGIDSVSEVLGSNVIGDLRRQRSEVQRSVEEVQARYGEKHPESIRVHDQLDQLDKQIDAEARRIVGSLRAAASAADASVASLRSSMSRLEVQQSSDTRNAVLADSLDREAKAKRAAYDRMSELSLNSTEAAKNVITSAEIIERARPLSAPSSPNKPLLIAAMLLVALGAGAATIAVQELMVAGLRTTDEVRAKLGMPVLAAVPKLPRSTSPSDVLLDKPTSMFSESLRIARAAILGVRSARSKQVIAITSALPSEGKTTTALAFARTLAINNAKTLLLECDVRRAQMRFLVNEPPKGPGIVELLHGEATLDQVITPGDVPKLDHLLVSQPFFSSEDLFGGGAMERLIALLRDRYEQIVLDLPPLIGLADGRFLAVLADATAVCVKWDATPADAISQAIGLLRNDGANPVGVIFTMVDSSAEAIGSLYYSKKYSAYYQAA
jgi:uncharacterized protein involved in exopolysaccharide biosynthesis/Mrp family chromosome partitioning ATPase